ncbi:hypothetical protein [Roseomonas chloroacetimidivorans]|uniref:hypothetical protein n=1 Tax=Roseomonas chloroacetimidivorans TaxID=1766656 RepID=UPI003C724DD8
MAQEGQRDPERALFARSAATAALVDLLVACPEGGAVSFAEMIKVTNRDVQRKDRHLLDRARAIALTEHRAAFCAVVREGLRRLRADELAHEGQRRIKTIKAAAKRGGKIMDSGDAARLKPEQRLQHAAVRGLLSAIETTAGTPQAPAAKGSRDPYVRIA